MFIIKLLFKCSILILFLSYKNVLLITERYICYWLFFLIDKSIIYQIVKKEHFLLYYLEDALTKFLFLLLSFLLKSFGSYT